MTQTAFLKHSVEVSFTQIGKTSKQMIPNLKETVESEKMVELGRMFAKILPELVELEDVVTVKRTRHQTA